MPKMLTTIWYRPAGSIFRQYILDNRPLWFFVVFGVLSAGLLWYFIYGKAGPGDQWVGNTAVEGFGFLMDIVLFGLLWSVFDVYRERRAKVRGYEDELMDFIPWEAQEGVLRKVGLIRRLNELRASLPILSWIHLEGADLRWTNLKSAYLEGANLEGANLLYANLEGASLVYANLAGTKDLTWDQLEGAKTDDGTILPAYLKENAPEWYKGKFAGEEGE